MGITKERVVIESWNRDEERKAQRCRNEEQDEVLMDEW